MQAASLDFSVIAPIAWVSLGAMVVLLGEVMLSRRRASAALRAPAPSLDGSGYRLGVTLALISSAALLLALRVAWAHFQDGGDSVFDLARPMLRLDPLASFATLMIALGALLSVWLSINYLPALAINHGEYYALLLLATTGMFVLVASVDMLSLFMGLELMSIPIYALAGFDRRRLRSNESGLKYFLVGAFASAILLYGMALLYGATGHTDFVGMRAAFNPESKLAMAGLALVLVGFAFKVSSVPFHQWTPDVYEGAPTSVTAFMSVTVKASAFVVLLRFLAQAVPDTGEAQRSLMIVLSALTMLVGNAMAIIQNNLKRMLAYSSIAHAGYVLVGFAAGTNAARAAIVFYLFVYVFMNLGAFGVLIALTRDGRERENVDDLNGLASQRPGLAAAMTLFLIALAGIPGTAGFVGKFTLFSAAVGAGLMPLAILGVLTSVVSVYFYLRIPVAMYMREPAAGSVDDGENRDSAEVGVIIVCAVAVLLFGLLPDSLFRLLSFAKEAVAAIN